MIGLFSSFLWASDPWNRPKELRIVPEPPQSWADLRSEEKRLRFWWEGENAELSMLTDKGWQMIENDIHPGWTSPPLPIHSHFRLRCEDGLRWSPATTPQAWSTPLEIGKIDSSADDSWLPSYSVTEIDQTQDGSVWFGILGGGVTQLKTNGETVHLGRWDGLLSERIVSIDAQNEDLLVGTSEGAVLLKRNSNEQRYWGKELPDRYVQRVLLDDSIWIGTYRGLFLESEAESTSIPLKIHLPFLKR